MNVDVQNGSAPADLRSDRDSADTTEHSEPLDSSKDKMNGNAKAENGRKAANAKDPSRPRRKKARRACFACQRAPFDVRSFYNDNLRNSLSIPGHGGTGAAAGRVLQFVPGYVEPESIYDTVTRIAHIQPQNYPKRSEPEFIIRDPTTYSKYRALRDTSQSQNPFAGPFFDPSDPALFNFDLSSMNFENRYGALEFGMLGHMATGAGDSPSDSATQRGSIGRSGSAQFSTPAPGFGESPSNQPFMFGDPLLNDWSTGQASGQTHVNVSGVYGQNGMLPTHMKADGPHAFAIESGPANFTSPADASSPHVNPATFDDGFNGSASKANSLAPNGQRPMITTPSLKHQQLQVGSKRRHRNPSSIYESVKEPYAYTSGFHNLTAFIQRRFSPSKTVRIAKALASIRPSFIATTKTLNRDDLIFMEKCFQRTLWEYEDFINACGTPTIVCRRTGEIAAVGKEFSKEPNMNVNTGGGPSAPASGTTSRGSFTPRSSVEHTTGRPQPVFLAELMDDESVVGFYEDFARLAFGDSRGSVMTRCKLLKYKTKDDMDVAQSDENGKWNNHLRKGGIAGEAGMNQLGFKDGKVECAYCWTVKRDVFDIPMLIVMNFLPCI
ncbi:hypothetical protein N7470_010042 [Penicillium chermesinum]|nr:hypothetical protein N7470_010042 [Penicillium chermesinum]